MKKLLIATAVATTLFAPQAFAQAKNFSGFNLGANVTGTKTTGNATAIAAGGFNADDSASTTGWDLLADYTFALGQSLTFGVGVTLGTSANKAGTEFTTKDRSALDFTPGVAVSDSVLLFGKVSVLSATIEGSPATGTGSKSASGFGYGIGARALINKNLYLQGGFDVQTLDKVTYSATEVKGKAGVISFGVGYKF